MGPKSHFVPCHHLFVSWYQDRKRVLFNSQATICLIISLRHPAAIIKRWRLKSFQRHGPFTICVATVSGSLTACRVYQNHTQHKINACYVAVTTPKLMSSRPKMRSHLGIVRTWSVYPNWALLTATHQHFITIQSSHIENFAKKKTHCRVQLLGLL